MKSNLNMNVHKGNSHDQQYFTNDILRVAMASLRWPCGDLRSTIGSDTMSKDGWVSGQGELNVF